MQHHTGERTNNDSMKSLLPKPNSHTNELHHIDAVTVGLLSKRLNSWNTIGLWMPVFLQFYDVVVLCQVRSGSAVLVETWICCTRGALLAVSEWDIHQKNTWSLWWNENSSLSSKHHYAFAQIIPKLHSIINKQYLFRSSRLISSALFPWPRGRPKTSHWTVLKTSTVGLLGSTFINKKTTVSWKFIRKNVVWMEPLQWMGSLKRKIPKNGQLKFWNPLVSETWPKNDHNKTAWTPKSV